MLYIAFTLGLFGSLHCVGMCGPLALAFCKPDTESKFQQLLSGLSYNLGRTFTYAIMGLLFGILGTMLYVNNLQKGLSIVLGVLLVISFLFSLDVDKEINKLPTMKKIYAYIRGHISIMYSKVRHYPTFVLGMANGLLPCGLVYLALAGALSAGGLLDGIVFMALFGLGTIPMMVFLVMGMGFLSPSLRQSFRKILPFVTLFFGLFLIYRGIVVDMPAQLDFWEALQNPIMCH